MRAVVDVPIARTFIRYIFSYFCFFAWENCNVKVVGIETDISSRAVLQIGFLVDETWLLKAIAYLPIINVPTCVLAVEKLDMPVDKNLVIVEMYPSMKPGRWDFIVEKK